MGLSSCLPLDTRRSVSPRLRQVAGLGEHNAVEDGVQPSIAAAVQPVTHKAG